MKRSKIDKLLGRLQAVEEGTAKQIQDITAILNYVEKLETFLDEADQDDTFGTEGWRHAIGIEE